MHMVFFSITILITYQKKKNAQVGRPMAGLQRHDIPGDCGEGSGRKGQQSKRSCRAVGVS